MKPQLVAGILAGLIVLCPARPVAAQAPADPTEKARAMIQEKWEARAAELAKIADADRDGALSEAEFDRLWDAAESEKHEIVRAVCAALGIAEASSKKAAGAQKPAGKGKKKGGGKKGGKKGGGNPAPDPAKEAEARKARIAEAFRAADADGDSKVTPVEAAQILVREIKAENDPTAN